MENLRLSFITYNVGTSSPDQSLLELLSLSSNPKNDRTLSDIYLVGFQEVKSQPQNILIDAFYNDPWTRAVQELLETRDYVKTKTIRLQGLVLSLFCLRKHLLSIGNIETAYVRTGLSGMWGNKGGVAIRISISGCSVCFINAHLSAHENMMKDRVKDYYDIVQKAKFQDPVSSEIFSHDYIFWMGDLNFRLLEDSGVSFDDVEYQINRGEWSGLLELDELQMIMRDKMGMHEFREHSIEFPPTFKFKVGTTEYDDKRKPAWTDRILFKVNEKNYDNVTLHVDTIRNSYKSHPHYIMSDHKPVTCDFKIKVFSNFNDEVYINFEPISFWLEDQDNTITYIVEKEFPVSKSDWIGVYKANFSSLDDYLTYEYVGRAPSAAASPLPPSRHNHPHHTTTLHSDNTVSTGRLRKRGHYTCSFSGGVNSERAAGAGNPLYTEHSDSEVRLELASIPVPVSQLCLVYVHETDEHVVSVFGCSNTFPLTDKVQILDVVGPSTSHQYDYKGYNQSCCENRPSLLNNKNEFSISDSFAAIQLLRLKNVTNVLKGVEISSEINEKT